MNEIKSNVSFKVLKMKIRHNKITIKLDILTEIFGNTSKIVSLCKPNEEELFCVRPLEKK